MHIVLRENRILHQPNRLLFTLGPKGMKTPVGVEAQPEEYVGNCSETEKAWSQLRFCPVTCRLHVTV